MNYMGDLSKYDYEVLKDLSIKSTKILEFGVGGSTQILSNFSEGVITSIETSDFWIDITKKNLKYLNIKKEVNFLLYDNFNPTLKNEYDFIFNDGIDSLRQEFAIKVWNNLKVGGIIAYHDTRRSNDIKNVLDLIDTFKDEVESVTFNKNNSNITLIKKKTKDDTMNDIDTSEAYLLQYYDWNDEESKIRVKYGISINPGNEIPEHLL